MTYTVYKFELPSNARPQERIQAAIGYLGGIFDIEELVDKLLHQLTGNPSIMVNLYDTTSEIPIRMYGSNDTDTDSGLWHVSPLNLGDPSRKHELRCRFTDRPQWPWLAITSSTVTLVIALLIGYISRATIKRNAKYEMNELKKGAEAPMTAESLFLASTTHGIRTATNGVLGMLRMLMDTDLDTTQQDYVRTAQAIAKVLVSLNNAVLDFYHGKLELKTVPFDGRPVCDDTLSLFCGEALEKGIDGYVSKPFEGELSNLAIHLCLEELKQDKIVEKQEEPNLHTRSKFITKFKKLTSACIHSFPSKVYVNKTVVSVGLLGFVLYILAIGIFELPFNQSLGIRSGDGNMTSNNFGHSRGRLLVDTPHGTWANRGVKNNGTISVDLGNMRGNSDSYGQQRHMSSHNSSAIIPAILSNWISNGNPDQSSIHQEETTQIRYRTVKPHLPLPAQKSHKIKLVPWIVLVAVIMLMLVLGIAVWLLLRCNSWKRAPQNELELLGGMEPRRFQLHELAAATSNFTEENRLGQGGFGPVYKGYLSDQDRHVAIKVLSKKQSSQEQSEQGLREFMAEVRVMTQLRHRNVVKLVGWCDSNKRLLLVYELMAQGSLDKHLYNPERILTWQERYKIALDLGSALLYLHRDCEKCVVHGDIKPANVMLDVSHNAKLGDFGLARLIEHGDEPRTTQVVAGTAGYIDPEFINNRWPRTELDVFSFGVVLLEIACGKRPASRHPNGASTLLAWVLHLYDRGLILDAADQRLNAEFDQRQMERVLVTGLWCARQDPMQRPSIVQAMDVLRSADAELPVLPAVVRDARRILSMEEQAYGELPVTDHHVHGVAPSMYFTSKDSGYLLAEE
ncbi:hypothetical protein BS78_04G114800 [Paspalum vaginatum]|nr:hypothetical protein BS78_04G114800 [Paspalum vaginatum]